MARREYTEEQPVKRRRRGLPWGKLFLFFLVVLVALAWFAPNIVVRTPLRDTLLGMALKDFPGTVTVGTVSAGWLSPVVMEEATAFDATGKDVLTVGAVRTQKNLFSLLLDTQDIGTVRVERPVVKLILRPDGTNLEDLLAPWLNQEGPSRPLGCGIEVTEGVIEATAADGKPLWRLEQIESSFTKPRDPAAAWLAKVKTAVTGSPGNLAVDLNWQRPVAAAENAATASLGKGTLTVQAQQFPLDLLSMATRRAGLDVQLAGLLTTNTKLDFSDESQTVEIANAQGQNLFVAAPMWLGTDQIQLASLQASGQLVRGPAEWNFRQVVIQSDCLAAEASGAGPRVASGSLGSELTSAFRGGNWEVRGTADLARVAAMLPATLRLREGTRISSGNLTFGFTSKAQADGNAWNAELNAAQLAAIHAGTAYEWKKPVSLKAAVRENASGMVVDELVCDSTFLQVNGRGTLAEGQMSLQGDLSQFVNEVGRFVELGQLRAAGQFQGNFEWRNQGPQLSLSGQGSTKNFELTAFADQPWKETQLDMTLKGTALLDNGRVAQVDAGTLTVVAAGDKLDAQLLQGVANPSADAVWPCRVHMTGNLARWLARMRMFVTLDPWRLDANEVDLQGDLELSRQRLAFTKTTGSAKNFVFSGSGLLIQEPVLQLSGDGAYDVAKRELTASTLTIQSSTLAAKGQNCRLLYAADQFAMDGSLQYRANLERLLRWMATTSTAPPAYRVQGEATGTAEFGFADGATNAKVTAGIDQFSYSTPAFAAASNGLTITPVNQRSEWSEQWKEPRLELTVEGTLDATGQQATLRKLEIAGESLSVGAAGTVREPLGRCDLELAGQYAYDLERLAARVRGMIGPQTQLAGVGQRPFTFRGPLFPTSTNSTNVRTASAKPAADTGPSSLAEMLVDTSIGWDKLVVQGFEIGKGEVSTKLESGKLQISPISLPVSEGKISLAPTVDVSRTPYMATIEPGVVVDQVRISPQMCRSWLKYLAPLAADATAAEGHFSVEIKDAQFPVSDPTGGNIEGTFTVHQAQIGPGPLSQEIISLVQAIRAAMNKQPLGAVTQPSTSQWLDMPEQKLNVQLADHRVYHRDMQVLVKDVSVKTSGWVSLDQQIGLVAEVPVKDEWVANDRYLASLRGQTIKLPIGGSLSRPIVDRTALRELTKQTVINAGSGLLQQELNRGLNRLFQPKPGTTPAPMP